MVFISTARCVGNTAEGFDEAVRGMKTALKERAEAEGVPYDHNLAVSSVYEISEPLDRLLPPPYTSENNN